MLSGQFLVAMTSARKHFTRSFRIPSWPENIWFLLNGKMSSPGKSATEFFWSWHSTDWIKWLSTEVTLDKKSRYLPMLERKNFWLQPASLCSFARTENSASANPKLSLISILITDNRLLVNLTQSTNLLKQYWSKIWLVFWPNTHSHKSAISKNHKKFN